MDTTAWAIIVMVVGIGGCVAGCLGGVLAYRRSKSKDRMAKEDVLAEPLPMPSLVPPTTPCTPLPLTTADIQLDTPSVVSPTSTDTLQATPRFSGEVWDAVSPEKPPPATLLGHPTSRSPLSRLRTSQDLTAPENTPAVLVRRI